MNLGYSLTVLLGSYILLDKNSNLKRYVLAIIENIEHAKKNRSLEEENSYLEGAEKLAIKPKQDSLSKLATLPFFFKIPFEKILLYKFNKTRIIGALLTGTAVIYRRQIKGLLYVSRRDFNHNMKSVKGKLDLVGRRMKTMKKIIQTRLSVLYLKIMENSRKIDDVQDAVDNVDVGVKDLRTGQSQLRSDNAQINEKIDTIDEKVTNISNIVVKNNEGITALSDLARRGIIVLPQMFEQNNTVPVQSNWWFLSGNK